MAGAVCELIEVRQILRLEKRRELCHPYLRVARFAGRYTHMCPVYWFDITLTKDSVHKPE